MGMNPIDNKLEELKEAIRVADGVDAAVPGTDCSVLAVPERMLGVSGVQVDIRPGVVPLTPENMATRLLRPNGEPVPEHWSTYKTGEEVVVKGYRWVIAHLGEKHLLLEPLGPVLVGEGDPEGGEGCG